MEERVEQDRAASSLSPEQKWPSEDGAHWPEPLRAAAQEQHHSPLRRLLRVLARPNKFQLILLQFNSPEYRDSLAQALLSSMPNGVIWKLDRAILGQFAEFEEMLAHQASQAKPLQITGLEAWQTSAGTDDLFKGFNYHREAIAALGCTLLLWLTEPDIKQFALEAPDMWAWRTLILDLSIELPKTPMLEVENRVMPVTSARISEVSRYLDETSEPTPSLVLEQVSNLIETGKVPEARALIEKWHDLLYQEEQPTHLKLEIMNIQAGLARVEGDSEQALDLLQEIEALCETIGDHAALARCYDNQALILQSCGKLDEALDLLHRQQALLEALGDRGGLAHNYGNQALILQERGQLDQALALHRQGQALFEALGDRLGLSRSFGNQGSIFWAWGKLDQAMTLLRKQQALCEAFGDHRVLSVSLANQAMILHSWGKLDEAMDLLQQQQALCEALGDPAWLASCLWHQGVLFMDMGQPQECLGPWQKAVALRQSVGIPLKDPDGDWEAELAALERELQP